MSDSSCEPDYYTDIDVDDSPESGLYPVLMEKFKLLALDICTHVVSAPAKPTNIELRIKDLEARIISALQSTPGALQATLHTYYVDTDLKLLNIQRRLAALENKKPKTRA